MKTALCRQIAFHLFICLILFASGYGQPFQRQTQGTGIENAYYGNGVAAADYNNDGFIDVYFVSSIPTHPSIAASANSLFKNNGDGTFENVAKQAGVEGIPNTETHQQKKLVQNFGASWGDFDNDGDPDLYLTNKGADELYQNEGDGTFKNITHSAGLDLLFRDSSTAVWFDLDNDGDLDLYVASYGEHGLPTSTDNVMYQNNGDATFTDITSIAGLDEAGFTYTTMVLDVNQDAAPDLYCVNDFGDNVFYVNNGDGTFREATQEFGLQNNGHGMGVTLGDYDNDGLFDIFLTNIADDLEGEWSPLFRQTGPGNFMDVTLQTGTGITNWAWGCEFFDFDLDGDLDLYVVNGNFGNTYNNFLFRNNNNGTFEDYSQMSGADGQEEARGLCVADFDNDGRLDMFVANIRGAADLYSNSMQDGNYLKIELTGSVSNRDARGAVVSVKAGNLTCHRPNDGIEFLGQSKTPLHFGLGRAQIVQTLTVEWPSGIRQEFQDIPVNQTIVIDESAGLVTSIQVKKDPLPHQFALLNNYPNPLKNHTQIHFRTDAAAQVKIEVYDILGRLVATPVRGHFTPGVHSVAWDGTDHIGRSLPAGIYVQKLSGGHFSAYRKIMIVK